MSRRDPVQEARKRKADRDGRHTGQFVHSGPGKAAESWPDFIPLGKEPPTAPFPADALPAPLARLVREAADAMNCPPDNVGLPLLALAGGAIANSRHLTVKGGYAEPPCLWAMVVSRKGSVKSPPLKMLRKPFDDRQAEHLTRFRAELEAWKSEEDEKARGPKPVLQRVVVSDVTTETLAVILGENPRGVMMVRDELAGLFTSMNQYKAGHGHDRQVYLAMWSGEPVLVDRKSDKRDVPVSVRNPFAGIAGTTQPEVLRDLHNGPGRRRGPDDGFLDRFIFSVPDPVPERPEDWRAVGDDALRAWRDCIDKLLGLAMNEGELGPYPMRVSLDLTGREAWEAFTADHAAEVNRPEFPDSLRGTWAKMKSHCARTALVLHYLRWACGECEAGQVTGEDVRRAAVLTAYYKAHARRAWLLLDADPALALARKLWAWVREKGHAEFSRREAYRACRGAAVKTPGDIDPPLDLLVHHELIRPLAREREGPGRKPSAAYEVNPEALRSYRDEMD